MMHEGHIHVLMVDDEPSLRILSREFLEDSKDMEVVIAGSVAEARAKLIQGHFDAIVCDNEMTEEGGLQFLRSLRAKGDLIPFILFTGNSSNELIREALDSGADSFLHNGGRPEILYSLLAERIREAVRNKRSKPTTGKSFKVEVH